MTISRRRFLERAGASFGAGLLAPWLERSAAAIRPLRVIVDPGSLQGKVLCGYQGWFRCPGDGAGRGWQHWSRSSSQITPDTLTIDMWPDVSELTDDELFPADNFTDSDGNQAYLFSSAHPLTVQRHFNWMQDYGIDGVMVQRFVVGLADPPSASQVLMNARDAANQTGRVFAVEYDMSGMPADQLFDRMVNDWHYLVDELEITQDPRYLHQDGLPVLGIWGFFHDRFSADLANQILDFFQGDPDYGAYVVGGCQWWWRTETDPGWPDVFRRFDAISPWNVGNYTTRDGQRYASTGNWAPDLAEAQRVGMLYMPVFYPGFSWDNLQRLPPGTSLIPRLGGDFLWDQFQRAAALGVDTAKVAMFDEVDEGTAIFKVSNEPPEQGYFVTYDGLPSDWYLTLTGQGTQLLRG